MALSGLPRQDGRTFVITGATRGIGLATARVLVAGGAHVIVACRDLQRGHEVVRSLGSSAEARLLDVSSLAMVRRFAEDLPAVDVVINNAGIMAVAESRTVDGFELQMATNHLGHFALSLLLLDAGKVGDRIVVVGSQAHRNARLDPADLNCERHAYDAYRAYANSKLANLLFMGELQRRLTEAGSRVRVTGAHPGYTATQLTEHTRSRGFNAVAWLGNHTVGMTPEHGAHNIVAAAVLDVPGNTYFGPGGLGQLWGSPTRVGRSTQASDPFLARALWAESARVTGVDWPG